jgi:hypothetical protein
VLPIAPSALAPPGRPVSPFPSPPPTAWSDHQRPAAHEPYNHQRTSHPDDLSQPSNPLHAPPEISWVNGSGEPPSFWKQLTVLVSKRWTCTKRDRKALLFQQVLPIGLVALILLILTLEDPRVGPALRMRASIYQRTRWGASSADPPTEFVATEPRSYEMLRHFDADALTWMHRSSPHSHNLSRYLLDSYNSHPGSVRMGAAAVRDALTPSHPTTMPRGRRVPPSPHGTPPRRHVAGA